MFSEGYFGWKVHPCRGITHYTGKREGAREWCQGVEQVIPRCRHPPSPLFGHEYDGGRQIKQCCSKFYFLYYLEKIQLKNAILALFCTIYA